MPEITKKTAFASAELTVLPDTVSGDLADINANTSGLPESRGQKEMADSTSVAIASNQSAVPVSGPLTNTELRDSDVPVSGPLTDVELRNAAVPVSGPLTDTELRNSAVPTSATQLPASVGQKAMTASLPVVIASDQSAVSVTPSANALATVTATIANAGSLSAEVDLGEGRVLVGIIMPAAWTAAVLTFQCGVATGTVANLYQFGAEVSYTVDASQYIAIQDVMQFYGARYVHVRSGTAAAAVAQGAERAITLVTARR